MSDWYSSSDVGVEGIALRFANELEVLANHQLNIMAINGLLFSYGQLRQLGAQFSHNPNKVPLDEMFLAHEALTTSVVASYGRLFTSGKGASKLDPDKIPVEHKAAHDELIGLRHNRYAHNGDHESTNKELELTEVDGAVVVSFKMTAGFYIGGSDSWEALFFWLNRHLLETLTSYLEHLSRKSGIKWKMEEGLAPAWVDSLYDDSVEEN